MASRRSNRAVTVVGCGKAKIWDKCPKLGKIQAKDAYTGSLFRLSRLFAEKHARKNWLILSAKYGLVRPNRRILNYDVTIGSPGATTPQRVRSQWRRLANERTVAICLASENYVRLLRDALPENVAIKTPLEGLDLFKRTPWLKRHS